MHCPLVYGLREETGENLHRHWNNLITPHETAPGSGMEPSTFLLWGHTADHCQGRDQIFVELSFKNGSAPHNTHYELNVT